MQSKAKTVDQYLAELPAERREAIAAVRQWLRDHLDPEYEENMSYGMIGYCVPHRLYPAGYHCDPKQALPFAALAAQKNYNSIYLMGLYMEPSGGDVRWFEQAWAKAGKKLDMGKACIRWKQPEDLAFDVLAEALRRLPLARYVAIYEGNLAKGARSAKDKSAPAGSGKSTAAENSGAKSVAKSGKPPAAKVRAVGTGRKSAGQATAKTVTAKPTARKTQPTASARRATKRAGR
jgi:hypothetical protein